MRFVETVTREFRDQVENHVRLIGGHIVRRQRPIDKTLALCVHFLFDFFSHRTAQ